MLSVQRKISISIHSTARVETQTADNYKVEQLEFQSTPPRGWRQGDRNDIQATGNFNPLHREGGDFF